MKIRYVNRCILSFRIISCCFQFIQVCSSYTCRHRWSLVFNSRTNVIDNGVTTRCIASCIFERYDYVICSYVITSRTIKVCCIRTIWTFNNFITIFICVNSRCYSVYCISFLTCCSISSFRYCYIIASFYNCTKASDNSLTSIIDVGKILFSNTCDYSFIIWYIFIITINISHSYTAIVLYSIATSFDMFFIIKVSYFIGSSASTSCIWSYVFNTFIRWVVGNVSCTINSIRIT